MSRLGDTIRNERTTRNLTAKQVAKKAGVSEGFLLDVESGRKIVESATAQRILKAIGAQPDALEGMEETAAKQAAVSEAQQPFSRMVPTRTPAPKPEKRPSAPVNEQWKDALGGIVKSVPVLDEVGKQVDTRLEATDGGRIAGAPADRVFYQRVEDDSLWRAHSIRRGDLLLVVPGREGLLVMEMDGARLIGRLLSAGANAVLVVGEERKTVDAKDVKVLGRAARLVRELEI